MEKAIIFFSKKDQYESYQLLIGTDYTSAIYDGSYNRSDFSDSLIEIFTKQLLNMPETKEILTYNGGEINTQTGRFMKAGRLEDSLVQDFRKLLVSNVQAEILKKSKENSGRGFACIFLGKK